MTDIDALNWFKKILDTREKPDTEYGIEQDGVAQVELAISALRDRSSVEDMKKKLKSAIEYKSYWDSLYGCGLEVANWHKNGNTEPLDSFIESAEELWDNNI